MTLTPGTPCFLVGLRGSIESRGITYVMDANDLNGRVVEVMRGPIESDPITYLVRAPWADVMFGDARILVMRVNLLPLTPPPNAKAAPRKVALAGR